LVSVSVPYVFSQACYQSHPDCRGSGLCGWCDNALGGTYKFVTDHLSDSAIFKDGQQIACVGCSTVTWVGTCVFAQNLGDKRINGKQVKEAVKRLVDHRCKVCGSAPLYNGNNVKDGQVTINYVKKGCAKGNYKIC
jgi:hypothetical protein